MDLLKQLLSYVFIIVLVWLAAAYGMPMLSRAQMPTDYMEIPEVPDVEHYRSYVLEKNVKVSSLQQGQVVCYRIKGDGAHGNGFGYIAAVPGDVVEISDQGLVVNGAAYKRSGALMEYPNFGKLVVPANYVYVVTTAHLTDSLARGPIPASGLRGRIGEFP